MKDKDSPNTNQSKRSGDWGNSDTPRLKENKSRDKQEIFGYLDQLACRLRRMIYNFQDLLPDLEEPYVRGLLRGVLAEKYRQYHEVLEIVETGPFRDPGAEKRLNIRRSALGTALLRPAGVAGADEIRGHCVNVSSLGLCVENSEKLSSGQTYEIEVALYGGPGADLFRGHVVWVREVLPGFYIHGFDLRHDGMSR